MKKYFLKMIRNNILNELKVISIKRQMDEDDKSLFNDKDKENDINIIKSIYLIFQVSSPK